MTTAWLEYVTLHYCTKRRLNIKNANILNYFLQRILDYGLDYNFHLKRFNFNKEKQKQ